MKHLMVTAGLMLLATACTETPTIKPVSSPASVSPESNKDKPTSVLSVDSVYTGTDNQVPVKLKPSVPSPTTSQDVMPALVGDK